MNTGQATLIRNGRVVTATDDCVADILIEGGRIQAIARTLPAGPGMAVHDATGLLVLPGAVDVHTHLEIGHAACGHHGRHLCQRHTCGGLWRHHHGGGLLHARTRAEPAGRA
jgi:predicted amidohydrolase YtcJ